MSGAVFTFRLTGDGGAEAASVISAWVGLSVHTEVGYPWLDDPAQWYRAWIARGELCIGLRKHVKNAERAVHYLRYTLAQRRYELDHLLRRYRLALADDVDYPTFADWAPCKCPICMRVGRVLWPEVTARVNHHVRRVFAAPHVVSAVALRANGIVIEQLSASSPYTVRATSPEGPWEIVRDSGPGSDPLVQEVGDELVTVRRHETWVSRDFGATWSSPKANGLPASGWVGVLVDRAQPSEVFALTHGELCRSRDGGKTFGVPVVPTRIGDGHTRQISGIVAADDRLYARWGGEVLVSKDDGSSFELVPGCTFAGATTTGEVVLLDDRAPPNVRSTYLGGRQARAVHLRRPRAVVATGGRRRAV